MKYGTAQKSSSSSLSSSRYYQDRHSAPRSKEFYEQGNSLRQYFYVMDLKGQVFLESSPSRNMATCIRDRMFLNFLIKNMQVNNTGLYPDIPYISLCGREVNFVTTIDPIAVLVFKDLLPIPSSESLNGSLTRDSSSMIASQLGLHRSWDHQLIYGSSLSQGFDPSLLAYSSSTGELSSTPHLR